MRLFKSRPTYHAENGIPLAKEDISVLHHARDYFEQLLSLIEQAQHRIVLCCLYLQDDEAGREVLEALHRAKQKRPALEIWVLVDWHRAQRGLIGAQKSLGNAAMYQSMAKAYSHSLPIYGIPVQTRELFGVLHLKGYIIDDTVLYSGASINNVYCHRLDKFRHDRYWLIRNASLANSMVRYVRQFMLGSAAVHRLDQPGSPTTRQIRKEIRAFRDGLIKSRYEWSDTHPSEPRPMLVTPIVGVGKNNLLNRVILQILGQAKRKITICTPYFNFPLAVKREVAAALKRGVEVDIIVGDKTANDFYIPPDQEFKFIGALPYLYEMNMRRFLKSYQRFIESGQLRINLWCVGEHTYHLKGIWVDQDQTLLTGNNLNPRAFRLDLENALHIYDPTFLLSNEREAELQSIMKDTRVLTHYQELETIADYPPPVQKLLKRLSRSRLDRLAYKVL